MNHGLFVALLATGILYGTPLVIAGLGELLAERSGVLNLGVEGMMLMGAVTAFWVARGVAGPSILVLPLAIVLAGVVAAATATIHAFLTITLRTNQIVSGLALTIFAGASGLSSYIATVAGLGGSPATHTLRAINVFGLKNVPVLGPLLFDENALVYVSWLMVVGVSLYINRTRPGLHLRAVGEDPHAADSMGISVTRVRYAHTIAGGAFAGIGGAFYTLAISPEWSDGITNGAGWIAIALVIFAFWRPTGVLAGAYLFGVVTSLGSNLEARGVQLPSELFTALPYLLTMIVLVVVSSGLGKRRLGAPAGLGIPYARDGG
ncbi:MAG TPA: ABC transporter permease [Solirubrobacteraceae bacterium]|nr:ABC transporter permease [Solirubrobacteraceae bacterium]